MKQGSHTDPGLPSALYDHPDQFKSVTPSDSWLEWLQELDDQAPFNPADKLDLMRSLWKLMEKATDGKPSHTFSLQECGWELCDRKTWAERYRPPPITQLQILKWRHWKPAQLKDLEPTTQRALEEKLRSHWANRLISHLIPFAAEIPAMAAVMGDGDDHQEFLHLLGDARFSTLRQRCLFFERLKKQDLLQVPWTESAVRQMLSKLQAAECTPNYIQQAWDTLKWFSSKFQTLDVESLQRLQSKKKSLQETLVSTTSTPQRKAVVPSREVIWALEQGAAAVGAVSHSKGVQAREAIDAFIMGLVRFQVGCCARFNDMQHTSPGTLKVTTSTIEMMAWQTKTASAFKIKKNPVPLIAPKLSLSGVDWWTDWVETLKTLFALERFQDFEQGFPGGDPETRLERQESEMAERGPDQTWGSSRVGSAIVLAFVQGLHSRLRISIGNPQDPAPVLGKLANRIHRRHLHQGEKECGRGHLGKSPLTDQGHQPGPRKGGQGGFVS